MSHPLMDAARRQDIHILTREARRITLGQPPADLDQERPARLPPVRPEILQLARRSSHALGREIVQHDNVRPGPDRRMRLLDTPALDLDFGREPTRRTRGADGGRDRFGDGDLFACGPTIVLVVAGPDVVILEHGHGAEVVAVRVGAADEDAVLFHEAEAGGRFAGSGQSAGPAVGAESGDERRCPVVCVRSWDLSK